MPSTPRTSARPGPRQKTGAHIQPPGAMMGMNARAGAVSQPVMMAHQSQLHQNSSLEAHKKGQYQDAARAKSEMFAKGKTSPDAAMMAGQPDAKKVKLDAMKTKASLEAASRFMDSPLTINSKPMHAPLSAVPASHRYLGSEIQCLMHAFGEVRFCAKEVLEMVEDAVREAAQNAIHFAANIGARKGSYKDGKVCVTAEAIVSLYKRNPRALQRMNDAVESARLVGQKQSGALLQYPQRMTPQQAAQLQKAATQQNQLSAQHARGDTNERIVQQQLNRQQQPPQPHQGNAQLMQQQRQVIRQQPRPARKGVRPNATAVEVARSLGYFSDDEPETPQVTTVGSQHAGQTTAMSAEQCKRMQEAQLMHSNRMKQFAAAQRTQPPQDRQLAQQQDSLALLSGGLNMQAGPGNQRMRQPANPRMPDRQQQRPPGQQPGLRTAISKQYGGASNFVSPNSSPQVSKRAPSQDPQGVAATRKMEGVPSPASSVTASPAMRSIATPSPHVKPQVRAQVSTDLALICSWRAMHFFRQTMPVFEDFCKYSERSSFVKSQTSGRMSNPLAMFPTCLDSLFREWLGLNLFEDVIIEDDALVPLRQIVREAAGLLTQTALLVHHFDEVNTGDLDPGAANWTYGRHILAAIGPGLITGILVDLTDAQLIDLRQEIENVEAIAIHNVGHQRWRGVRSAAKVQCLLPQHVKEALRRLNQRSYDRLSFTNSATAALISGTALS